MLQRTIILLLFTGASMAASIQAQVVINEASSRNAHTIADAAGNHHDWVELYNAGDNDVDLAGYTLTDDAGEPGQWTFPSVVLPAHGHLVVFCSGEDRDAVEGMTAVAHITDFAPVDGWNDHTLSTPFAWDGTSNLVIQMCALKGTGTGLLNAVFRQTTTSFNSSASGLCQDPSRTCALEYGDLLQRRPVMRVNGQTIGSFNWMNSFVQLPAPYANWSGGAKHAFLIRASELLDAGLSAGSITNLSFDVVDTHDATLDQLDIFMTETVEDELSASFRSTSPGNELHTNFKLGRNGETVYLYAPGLSLVNSLYVLQGAPDHSNGRSQDGGTDSGLFISPTPGSPNGASPSYPIYALAPQISAASALSQDPILVNITQNNTPPSEIRYTLNGSEPTESSLLYTGPLTVNSSSVVKARVFKVGRAPSAVVSASYLIDVHHTTPVISVVTPQSGLYGPDGIFTNWQRDDEIQAHVDYFGTDGALLFSQFSGMQVDGGLGGSRGWPQHSFRLEFDNDALGDGRVNLPLIPDRPSRARYSRIYLRNGSNQYQILPHKDAAQVKMMAGATNSYYAAWTPVTVYINGAYFGLYELREKFDSEYFRTLEGADPDSVDLLSLSAWSGSMLRPTEGAVDPFWVDVSAFGLMDPAQENFWDLLDARFDLTWYTDYIIGQQWMGTKDWPVNNIKVQRSDATDMKWRFCTIDHEVAMAPNGQSDHTFNALNYTASQLVEIPYTRLWQVGVTNPRFHDHFINRFADVMNSAYLNDRILGIAQEAYDLTRPEMGLQFQRWSSSDTVVALNTYADNHLAFLADLEQRTPVMRDHIQAFFGLPRQLDVTLDVAPVGTGSIRISTLHPEAYPWEGVYFDGVPVRIEAVANSGYQFSHWTANGLVDDVSDPLFFDTLTANSALFEAHFLPEITTAVADHARGYFSLHPNPTTSEVFISDPAFDMDQAGYQVVDLSGRVVMEGVLQQAHDRARIGTGALPNGSYRLRIITADGTSSSRPFVKL
ncbi:MAG: CotH kinase family protein [Flavobacteriales bacterium]|nr:CotH kinase family protein [Flavobacteriales bacterium]